MAISNLWRALYTLTTTSRFFCSDTFLLKKHHKDYVMFYIYRKDGFVEYESNDTITSKHTTSNWATNRHYSARRHIGIGTSLSCPAHVWSLRRNGHGRATKRGQAF